MKIKKAISENLGLTFALLSAFLYAFTIIIEKKYITFMDSYSILFYMYLGAGLGLFIIHKILNQKENPKTEKITRKEVPKIILIVVCELLASFFIIEALKQTSASLVSLLSISEIVMTSIIAYLFFKDPMNKSEIIAIILVLTGSFILNFKGGILDNIQLSSIYVIVACFCWGLANNITASISNKEPTLFTAIKCTAVALMYLILIVSTGELIFNNLILIFYGFFSYGLGILFYAVSTKYLKASKATLVFSFSPVFSILLSVLFYKDTITLTFLVSAILMITGILYMNKDTK